MYHNGEFARLLLSLDAGRYDAAGKGLERDDRNDCRARRRPCRRGSLWPRPSRRLTRASPPMTTRPCSSRSGRKPRRWPAARLAAEGPAGKPLYGVPFAVKDNIDVAGLPTTAACPAFAYRPERSAFVVEALERAGAIVIGKTNLDQFATGLVGVRSPYGVPRNALRADLIPGGSSSGSAAAVGAGLVPFSLGTDTAGSGRVPAALNGIVGLEAHARRAFGDRRRAGLPHARHDLDLRARRRRRLRRLSRSPPAFDERDAYSPRVSAAGALGPPRGFAIGAPRRDQCSSSATRRRKPPSRAISSSRRSALEVVEFDFEPFAEAARRCLRGPLGRRALRRGEALIETQPRRPTSGHPRDHRSRAEIRRGRGVRGVLQARRAAAESRARAGGLRRDARPDHAAALHGRRGRGRAVPAQFATSGPTPISSTCSIFALSPSLRHARRRPALERDADRAGGRGRPDRRPRRGGPRALRRADGRDRRSGAGRQRPPPAQRRADRARRGRRASFRPAAEPRACRPRRRFVGEVETTPTTGSSPCRGRGRRSRACSGSPTAPARRSRPRSGRSTPPASAPLSPRFPRRSELGRCGSPAADVKGFLVEAEGVARSRLTASAAGGPIWPPASHCRCGR